MREAYCPAQVDWLAAPAAAPGCFPAAKDPAGRFDWAVARIIGSEERKKPMESKKKFCAPKSEAGVAHEERSSHIVF